MKNKKPHSIPTLREIYDYIFRRHANGQRHRLERKMQQDPFVDDAVEGFTLVGEDRARKDIAALQQQIRGKNRKAIGYWYAGIAASLLLLIVAGTAYLLLENSRGWQQQSQLAREQERIESLQEAFYERDTLFETEKLPVVEEESLPATEPARPKQESTVPVIVADADYETAPDADDWLAEEEILAVPDSFFPPVAMIEENRIALREVTGAAVVVEAPRVMLPEIIIEPGYRIIRAQVLDGEDNSPIPGVTVSIAGTTQGTITDMNGFFSLKIPDREDTELVFSFIGMSSMTIAAADIADDESLSLYSDLAALHEVVVIGYGVQDNRQGHEQGMHRTDRLNRRDYSPPMPVEGYTQLNRYLRDNALLPDTASQSRMIVVLRFDISYSGHPVNFEVLRSPSPEYAQMAMNLIRQGPAWQPATLAGSFVQESVRVRIVFRKEQ